MIPPPMQAEAAKARKPEAMKEMPLDFRGLLDELERGEFPSLPAVLPEVDAVFTEAAAIAGEGSPSRKARLLALGEQLASGIKAAFQARHGLQIRQCAPCRDNLCQLLHQAVGSWLMKDLPPETAVDVAVDLPASILTNREPYLQGDWRKEPYIPRQVQVLSDGSY